MNRTHSPRPRAFRRDWPLPHCALILLGLAWGWLGLSPISRGAESIFADPVVVTSSVFEIRESDLQEAYTGHKAAAAALGQRPPPALERRTKEQILDRMIATRLVLTRALPADREEGKKTAERLIAESQRSAGSEASYRRRLLAVGSSPEKYEAEIQEQAVVQAVLDRELKKYAIISDADIKKFYDENPALFDEPEKARAAQILFATRKIPSGEPLPLEVRLEKKKAAEGAVTRARAGEDFSALVAALSDDPESKTKNGELTFARGQGVVPPQFEAAAFSLQPGQISEPVLTVFGYHVIKLLEKTPTSRTSIDKAHARISERLQRQAVQAKLPEFVGQLRTNANVRILLP